MSSTGGTTRFSIIAACYRVEPYLDEFFDSIEVQDVDDDELEVIAVDDGSDDGTLEALTRRKERSRFRVVIVQKPNGGQASARNLGLAHAVGEWLTFTDPDDWVDRDYFGHIRAFIDSHPDVQQVAARLVLMREGADGSVEAARHPLDAMFVGDRLHNLDAQPEYFSGSAPASFVRADLVRRFGLEFDTEIKPNFEDAHFVAKYLLRCPEPLLGLVGSAKYYYRKRGDGSSTLQTSLAHPSRYLVVPERGYLDLFAEGRRARGSVPEWIQNLVLYDLSWYFSAAQAPSGVVTAAVGEVAESFVNDLARLASELSPAVIRSFDIRPLDPSWRQILLHSFTGQAWSTDYVITDRRDPDRGEVLIAFRFVGPEPEVWAMSGDVPVDLVGAKVRSIRFFDHDLLFEWSCWISAHDNVVVFKNSEPMEIRPTWRGPTKYRVTAAADTAGSRSGRSSAMEKYRTVMSSRRQRRRVARKYATIARNLPIIARQRIPTTRSSVRNPFVFNRETNAGPHAFERAWVLIDRVHNANDSAEMLFRYLRASRPDINAWFVVEDSSPDYARLIDDGFEDRVVAYGSRRWKMLMADAVVVVSSHADDPIFDPPAMAGIAHRRWRRAFLNHGVIKDDLSGWLNPQHLDLFVVSTLGELHSIIDPGSPYAYSERETKLTGMPRFDMLERARSQREAAGRPKDLVVVAPTWRHWLLEDLRPGSQRRHLNAEFADSDFFRLWSQYLTDPRLAQLCQRYDLELAVLPHPNLEQALGMLERVGGIEVMNYDRPDLHTVFARTAVLVTDYSSVAFNVAYLESPTVYFQFDADRMFAGEHVGRKGYFDYPTMGFGPVVSDLASAIEATTDMVAALDEFGRAPEPWRSRIETTFPFRDGRCSARVATEVERILSAVDSRALVAPRP